MGVVEEPGLMQRHRLTVAEYHRMAEAGVRAPDARVELIEVSETTLAYDRGVKLPLCARHGVPEVWVVDLDNRLLRFFRRPAGDNYADITATETPGATPIALLPGVSIDLAGILS